MPQVLYEYWVVATRPTDLNGLGLSVDLVASKLDELRKLFSFLQDERAIFATWFDLVSSFKVAGKSAHDARLVAAMKRHSIPAILTWNARDFRRYESITVWTPDGLLEKFGNA